MSSALSLVNGLSIPTRDKTTSPSTLTTKDPFRGFSGLIVTSIPPALSAFASDSARVLNAPQDLQASMVATFFDDDDDDDDDFFFFSTTTSFSSICVAAFRFGGGMTSL